MQSHAGITFSKNQDENKLPPVYSALDNNSYKAEILRLTIRTLINPDNDFVSPFSQKIMELIEENPQFTPNCLQLIPVPIHSQTGKLIQSVAFSPDSKMLACGSESTTLWNMETLEEFITLKTEAGSIAFNPQASLLAIGSHHGYVNGKLEFWNLNTYKPITTLKSSGKITSLAFSLDGTKLASAYHEFYVDKVNLWSVDAKNTNNNCKLITKLSYREEDDDDWGHSGDRMCLLGVNSVAFSPNKSTLACGSKDRTIKLWNISTQEIVSILVGHDKDVTSVAFNKDGTLLASGSYDGFIKIWDPAKGKEVSSMDNGGLITSVAFSPNDKVIAVGSKEWGNNVTLWKIGTNKPIAVLPSIEMEEDKGRIFSVAFSPDGKYLAAGSDYGLQLWVLRWLKSIKVSDTVKDFLKTLYPTTQGVKKFLLLNEIFDKNATIDAHGKPKRSRPLDLYNPAAIALYRDLPEWLQKALEKNKMVRIWIKKK